MAGAVAAPDHRRDLQGDPRDRRRARRAPPPEVAFANLVRIAGRLGFRPDVRLMHLADGARLQIVQVRRVNLGGYWRLIHFRNAPAEPAQA